MLIIVRLSLRAKLSCNDLHVAPHCLSSLLYLDNCSAAVDADADVDDDDDDERSEVPFNSKIIITNNSSSTDCHVNFLLFSFSPSALISVTFQLRVLSDRVCFSLARL